MIALDLALALALALAGRVAAAGCAAHHLGVRRAEELGAAPEGR